MTAKVTACGTCSKEAHQLDRPFWECSVVECPSRPRLTASGVERSECRPGPGLYPIHLHDEEPDAI